MTQHTPGKSAELQLLEAFANLDRVAMTLPFHWRSLSYPKSYAESVLKDLRAINDEVAMLRQAKHWNKMAKEAQR